jgi:putative drug exporter of the RND superfamily
VDAPTGRYVGGQRLAPPDPSLAAMLGDGAAWVSAVPLVEPVSAEGEQLVAEICSLEAKVVPGLDTYVGGVSAELVDAKNSIF